MYIYGQFSKRRILKNIIFLLFYILNIQAEHDLHSDGKVSKIF